MFATSETRSRPTMLRGFKSASHRISAPVGGELDNDALRAVVPSIFAGGAHASRSDRYVYIPTARLVDAMRAEGFKPTFACEAKVRDETREGYAKHLIRFRHDGAQALKAGGAVPEVVLVNSHDGSSSYHLMAGAFRMLCLNGLMVGDTFGDVTVRHSGNDRQIIGDVIEGSYEVVKSFERIGHAVEKFTAINLQPAEANAFAEAARELRWETEAGQEPVVRPSQLLAARRQDDRGADLWRTLNVVQENMIRGGVTTRRVDELGRTRRREARPVNGIDQNVAINRALWTLAQKMAELKQAA